MDFCTDSDYSTGSSGIGCGMMTSTPKRQPRVSRQRNRDLRDSRIMSPLMPSSKLSKINFNFPPEGSMICHAENREDVNRRKSKNKFHENRLSVQPKTPTKEFEYLKDECESEAPIHSCKICGKSFFHYSAVRAHELLHTSTLPRKQFFKSEQILNTAKISKKLNFIEKQNDRIKKIPTETVFQKFNLNLSNVDNEESKKEHQCKVKLKIKNMNYDN